ncbi:hypothetical protein DI09_432p10 [Mitosporidium daphniae]|uniref:Uncharacterized protein n=1 Tax=Mitosporidium daphniae TaxID=1485682 RepID=A0A098VQ74_9MICR|nr:hypothetical protein DI09_432p10 [Mitosporidium daphniae]|eukprot:XP_013237619.1 uncharacterized protein DI09_432p10 [Mitosporidium daphniae]
MIVENCARIVLVAKTCLSSGASFSEAGTCRLEQTPGLMEIKSILYVSGIISPVSSSGIISPVSSAGRARDF